ncbi:MAG: galactose/methyl galactoside ABC transporter permease MglC [Bacillota bacterium]
MSEKLARLKERGLKNFIINNAIAFVLLGLLGVIIAISPDFVTVRNFKNILQQSSTRVIMALGVGSIIVAKGTDLSLGRQIGLAAVISASLLQAPDYAYRMYPDLQVLPLWVPIVGVMLVTGFFSFINGFVIAKFKVDPFIQTLGMMIIVYGVNSLYFDRPPYGAQPIGGLDKRFAELAQGTVFGMPKLIIFATIAVVLMWVIWNKTIFGKNIFAIGGNSEAALVSGVNVFKNLLLVYTMAGFLYGFAGALEGARIGSATSNTGLMYELDAISACIVGGLSFDGGIGSIAGIVSGVLIFQVIAYGLSYIGVSPYMQYIIKGLIIIIAVAIDSQKHRN